MIYKPNKIKQFKLQEEEKSIFKRMRNGFCFLVHQREKEDKKKEKKER